MIRIDHRLPHHKKCPMPSNTIVGGLNVSQKAPLVLKKDLVKNSRSKINRGRCYDERKTK